MKNLKILKHVVYGLLVFTFLIEQQYCSQEEASAAFSSRIDAEIEAFKREQKMELQHAISPQTVKPNRQCRQSFMVGSIDRVVVYPVVDNQVDFDSHNCKEHDIAHDSILQSCDPAIVAYWTNQIFLSRMVMNQKTFGLPWHKIFHNVVKIDDVLQKNKEQMKESLYQQRIKDVKHRFLSDLHMRDSILDSIERDPLKTKEHLWLEHLYAQVNWVHKNVESRNVVNSYYAWPYIKEIHVIKKFPTMYGGQVST